MDINILENRSKDELVELAKEMGISSPASLKKQDIIMRLLQVHTEKQGNIFCSGILEIMNDGYGFLRQGTLLPSSDDIYVSQSQIRRFSLRTGDMVTGQVRPPKSGEKYRSLLRVEAINDINPEMSKKRPYFNSLTPTFPDRIINLETTPNELSTRLMNLIAPIGRGQRGLIVSPPKAGKTMLLKSIANSATTNYNDLHIMVCLIGERPEEVTDMKRSLTSRWRIRPALPNWPWSEPNGWWKAAKISSFSSMASPDSPAPTTWLCLPAVVLCLAVLTRLPYTRPNASSVPPAIPLRAAA
jgi:transcription termination factor Rho